jgi:pyridoxal phosphate enzyme (YggS family)
VTAILEGLADLRRRIASAGGDPERVAIIAVTKGHGLDAVQAALDAGVLDVGESYAQELRRKAEAIESPVRWHFIGGLQRNKVRLVAPFVHLWQSVDRLSLAGEIARHAPGAAVLVQVNVAGQEHQGGCPPERVASVLDGCTDLGLEVRGLMAIGPQGTDAVVRAAFRRVRELADQHGLPERSMGMSGDLEAAVAEGSTMVRVGTALFGPRGGSRAVGT